MVCKNCGKETDGDIAFCPYCGAKAESGAQPVSESVCINCGRALNGEDLFCPDCGAPRGQAAAQPNNFAPQGGNGVRQDMPPQGGQAAAPNEYPPQNIPAPPYAPAPNAEDAPSGGFFALGFFFPLIGLILFLVWKDSLPLRSKSCGKGALIGVIVWFALGFVLGLILGIAGASMYAETVGFGLLI